MITDTEIANRAQPLVDKPYALGDVEGKTGWDCLSALGAFYGDALPQEYKGITALNYARFWKKDEKKARELLAEYLLSLGEVVDIHHSVRGDLVILSSDSGDLWAGIYLGNENLWVCAGKKHGCSVISLTQLLRWTTQKVISVRRIFK